MFWFLTVNDGIKGYVKITNVIKSQQYNYRIMQVWIDHSENFRLNLQISATQ
jgi:hypothetical protein